MIKNNLKDFKDIYYGPSTFQMSYKKKLLRGRALAWKCKNWNRNQNNLVAINMGEHDYSIDMYMFSIVDFPTVIELGWMFFDDIVEKSVPVIEGGSTYLTIPIKELKDFEEFD